MVFLFWVCLCLVMGPPDVQQGAHVFKRLRTPPKPPLLYYCEVCKISCVGPQPYKEHHEGQKHKKKEVGVKAGTSGPFTRGGNLLCCELCNVACTSSDDYAAHIRGLKHQKVIKTTHPAWQTSLKCLDDQGSWNSCITRWSYQ